MNNPLVSVIIPVYNGERYLAQAIENVLNHNPKPFEVIVVDDGSTDGTQAVASHFKNQIHYEYQPNSGAPSARNTGLKMARGNLIAFLDADDLWSENKLVLQLAHLTNDPSLDIVLGFTQLLMLTKEDNGKPKFKKFAEPQLAFQLGGVLIRKSVFDQVGMFNETLAYCDDYDWFMRARELGISILIHKEVTLFYRRHESNITNQRELDHHYTVRMLKLSLDRRRPQKNGLTKSLPKLSSFFSK